MTPPLGFSTPPHIPSNTTSERLPITTTVFAATTPENTPFTYHASTSTNPNPTIIPTFIEANYEILESLLRERRRQIRNEDLRTKLEYFSEDYDEEREIEPRPKPHREVTLTLRLMEAISLRLTWGETFPLTVEAREVATNSASNDQRDSFERSKKSSWDNNRGQKKDRFSPYRGSNHGLLPSLLKSPKEILATEKAARSFEPPPKMFGSKRTRDTSKYFHFHEDYGHDTNDSRYLRTQIQEAINSRQLLHLVKGIKKERKKSSDTTRGEIKKDNGDSPTEAPILMVSQETHIAKSLTQENTNYGGKEIIFPPVEKVNNAPVIIKAKIFRRKVGRVYMDSESSCKIIYEHYFEKLNPTIKASKVDLKTPLVGFSGERSWSIGKVPLEITIGDAPSQG
ncbi:hypothetical protein Tco_1170696 [Tanacetum coccineum]